MLKQYKHYIIAVLIGLFVAVALKPGNGLTEQGVVVLAITLPVLYSWLTINTHWTSLLYLGMLIMAQIMAPAEVWAASLGNSVAVTIIVFMVLSAGLKETGVINKVAMWFMTRKVLKNRPYLFLAMFFFSNILIGMFVENMSLAIIYIGLAGTLCETIGVKKGNSFYTCMYMGILWCNVVISIASPIAHAPVVMLMGMMEQQLGITVSFADWLKVGVPFAAIMLGVMMLCVRFWKPDVSAFRNYDVEAVMKNEKPLDARGKITAAVFLVSLFFIIAPEFLGGLFPAFTAYMKSIGSVIPALLAVVLLAVIHVDGKPVLDVSKAMQSIPLSLLIFGGAVVMMSSPMSSPDTGVTIWLSNCLKPLIGSLSANMVIIILIVLALAMTNFLSNVVTMVLFFNIGVSVLAGSGMNLGAVAIAIGVASSMAVLTPSASIPAPMFFAAGHVTVKDTLKANLLFVLLSLVVMLVYVIPFVSAVIR